MDSSSRAHVSLDHLAADNWPLQSQPIKHVHLDRHVSLIVDRSKRPAKTKYAYLFQWRLSVRFALGPQ